MLGREIITCLKDGYAVFGSGIVADATHWPATCQAAGLDFAFLCSEHVPRDRKELSWMCRAYSGIGVAPLVRVPAPDPYLATMVMDGGAHGVIFPYVESVEQVRAFRGALKYRPLKGRRLQRVLDGTEKLNEAELAFYEKFNPDSVFVCNIESVAAVEALKDIVQVPDLNAVLIGPHDLSINLGIPEQYDHPLVEEPVLRIIDTARRAGVGAGIHFWGQQGDIQRHIQWVEAGANFIVQSSDLYAFQTTIASEVNTLRKAAGQSVAKNTSEAVTI
jgi:4-hydroxy-2-oxoheptanedioate aldolase